MAESTADLLARWKRNPDESTTVALCTVLGSREQLAHVAEVGKAASLKHASSPKVLLAIAEMYTRANMLGDAQGLLVSAGKMAPKNADIYGTLGEVLLRRGDAERAQKVFERALLLGKVDEHTQLRKEQATGLLPLQKRGGAAEVARAFEEILRNEEGSARAEFDSEPSTMRRLTFPSGPNGIHPSEVIDEESPTKKHVTGPLPALSLPPISPRQRASGAPPRNGVPAPGSLPPLPAIQSSLPPLPAIQSSLPPPPSLRSSLPPAMPTSRRSLPPPPTSLPSSTAAVPTAHAAASRAPLRSILNSDPELVPHPFGPNSISASAPPMLYGIPAPAPRLVLQALASTGLFEQGGASTSTWEAAPARKTRFLGWLVALTILVVGSGAGGYSYVRVKRAERAAQAREIDARVMSLLRAGRVSDFAQIEQSLSLSFDLDSNSAETSKLWLRDRVLRTVQLSGEESGIDSGIGRARQAGVGEGELVFAKMGAFLAQGDVAGAAASIPQGDKDAARDAMFQLMAGVALERAGDPRASERYQLATQLDPDLFCARMLLARSLILDGDLARGRDVVRDLSTKWTERPEQAALVALAFLREGKREGIPAEAQGIRNATSNLPSSLAPIPAAVDAFEAMFKGDIEAARQAILRALPLANTPSMATWLGTLALQMGDDATARQGALQAVSFSALYPKARVLAARVALLQGRLDEALQAVGELEPGLSDVILVRAAVAYERTDGDALTLALDVLAPEVRASRDFQALRMSKEILRGVPLEAAKIRDLWMSEAPWADVVALDSALDIGNLTLAREIEEGQRGAKDQGARAVRLARLQRYSDKDAEADATSAKSLASYPTLRSLLQRLLTLAGSGRADEARSILARNATLLGPMQGWALSYLDAMSGKAAEGRARVALLDVPPDSAPLPLRLLAMLSVCELGDRKRCGDLLRPLSRAFPKNPEVLHASAVVKGAVPAGGAGSKKP